MPSRRRIIPPTIRVSSLTIPLACVLALGGSVAAEDAPDGRPLPPAETARDLPDEASPADETDTADAPDPAEARDVPGGTTARPVPEGVEARALPQGREARPLPDGATPRSGPVDPPPARPAPARGSLLPAPLDEPLPEDAGRNPDFWRERRERAERNLERIRAERHETEDAFTQACRYVGGDRCDRLREEAWKLHRQEVAIEAYLDEGLREQCRRAGCLPGWVRD